MMLQVNTKFLGQVARGWAQDRARRKAEREEEEEKTAPASPAPAPSEPAPDPRPAKPAPAAPPAHPTLVQVPVLAPAPPTRPAWCCPACRRARRKGERKWECERGVTVVR